jgi:hypothetical protein
MEMRVLRPKTRMLGFLPRRVAVRDDSGVAKGADLLVAEGEGARTRKEAGVAEEVPTVVTTDGGGGTADPRTMWG